MLSGSPQLDDPLTTDSPLRATPSQTSDRSDEKVGKGKRTAWNLGLSIFFALDVLLLFVARPFHRAVFEGEMGIVELPTFFVLMAAMVASFVAATKETGRARAVFVVLALGCLFWGGEEVDWGQTFLHWATPAAISKVNYQHEFNVHNTKGGVGTIMNVIPRFVLFATMVGTLVLALPWAGSLRQRFRERIGSRWLAPLSWCIAPATLAVAASIVNKTKPYGYKGFGESQELFIAFFLLAYAVRAGRSADEDSLF